MYSVISNRTDAIMFSGTYTECQSYMERNQLSLYDFRISTYVPTEENAYFYDDMF